MKDPKYKIYKELVGLLGTIDTPVYTVIPANSDKPFVYLGDIQLTEIQNKSQFFIEGFVSIELYSGSNGYVGSLKPLLDTLYQIKYYLQPNKGFVIDLTPQFSVSYWKLSSDSGLIQYSITERLHVATLQYTFKLLEASGFASRVDSDNGIMEALDCIPIQYR